MALGLEQRVGTSVHHHGGGRHGDDSHAVADAGLEAVVPLVVGHGQQPWVGRNGESAEKRFIGWRGEKTAGAIQKAADGFVETERESGKDLKSER